MKFVNEKNMKIKQKTQKKRNNKWMIIMSSTFCEQRTDNTKPLFCQLTDFIFYMQKKKKYKRERSTLKHSYSMIVNERKDIENKKYYAYKCWIPLCMRCTHTLYTCTHTHSHTSTHNIIIIITIPSDPVNWRRRNHYDKSVCNKLTQSKTRKWNNMLFH